MPQSYGSSYSTRFAAPPTIRLDATGYYPEIPGTAWARGKAKKYFADEVSARVWARQTWCTTHHRQTCPPILLDTSIHSRLADPEFRTQQIADQVARLQDGARIIPDGRAHGMATAAWDAPRLQATKDGGPEPTAWQHFAWEDLDYATLDAGPSYAGMLEDGVAPQFHAPRVVYISPAVHRDLPTEWHQGSPTYPLTTIARLLWAINDPPPADTLTSPPTPVPIEIFGAFVSEAQARDYAITTLQADYVIPRVSRWVLRQDARNLVPLRLVEPALADAFTSSKAVDVQTLSSSVQAWIAEANIQRVIRPFPTLPDEVGVWIMRNDGTAHWFEESPGFPYHWPVHCITHPKFVAWMAQHQLVLDPRLTSASVSA